MSSHLKVLVAQDPASKRWVIWSEHGHRIDICPLSLKALFGLLEHFNLEMLPPNSRAAQEVRQRLFHKFNL